MAEPIDPAEWKKVNSITIAFGHGVSTTPLQTAVAAARADEWRQADHADLPAARQGGSEAAVHRVIRQGRRARPCAISIRLNAEKGSGKRAEVPGYRVGGKTGTAEKVVNGRYSKKRVHAFLAIPDGRPEVPVPSIISTSRRACRRLAATAGLNAGADVAATSSSASGALLGVKPRIRP